MAEKGPIISKWVRDAKNHDVQEISKGTESVIQRHVFSDSERQSEHSLAVKDATDRETVEHVLETYENFKKYNLPVVDFLKVKITNSVNSPEGQNYCLLMEDLTENQTFNVSHENSSPSATSFSDYLGTARAPKKIARQIFQSLAVIHNNGYYNFHAAPGLGIVTRAPLDSTSDRDVDFKIIDYTNFKQKHSSFHRDTIKFFELWDEDVDFERLAEEDVEEIARGRFLDRVFEKDEIKDLINDYKGWRKEKILKYDPER